MKTRLEQGIERARTALRGDDLNEIRSAQEELQRAYSEAGQSLYAQQGAAGAEGAAPEGAPAGEQPAGATAGQPTDDVVEADYEIVDEDKK
jgi:molecular chaperone DnaK